MTDNLSRVFILHQYRVRLRLTASRHTQPLRLAVAAGLTARVHIEFCRVLTTSGLNFKVELKGY